MILTPERQKLCAECIALTPKSKERKIFATKHDIRGQELFYYKRDYKASGKKTRAGKRKARTRALTAQQGRCALCNVDITPGSRCCLDKAGKTVCMVCNQYLTLWRKYQADGISEQDIVAFTGIDTTQDTDTGNTPDTTPDGDVK